MHCSSGSMLYCIEFKVALCTMCLWYPFTLSLLKEPVILFLRELRVLFTLVPFSTFSVRSSSSSFLVEEETADIQKYLYGLELNHLVLIFNNH